ncbi:MAG TPA: MFS transporter, partial [Candidatus Eisenbacteria bacterium]|nr:MFS transporter [Candidatus Eisenbacteria bacterium]
MKIHSSVLRPDPRRWLALIVVCFGQLMIVLDSTIVNVALPSIQRDLHFSQADLTWVVNAYLITYGSLLLLAGRAGDLIGRKRVF